MLPSRAYSHIPTLSLRDRTSPEPVGRVSVLLAVPPREAERLRSSAHDERVAHTTAEAVHAISQRRPRVIVVDWNADGIDGPTICMAVASFASTGILALIDDPMLAPAPLKAGCHAILLRPCPLNLVAARIGRLSREMPTTATSNGHGTRQQIGTNHVWVGTACPACGHDGGTSFEFSSHRRMWYACLACDHVWLGPRQE